MAASALGAVLFGRGGGHPRIPPETALPPENVLPVPATPEPAASPQPYGNLFFLESSRSVFERVEFAPNDVIGWRTGVFFMDTGTGAMTGYRLRDEFQGHGNQVTVAGPRFVLARDSRDGSSFLLDRTTGQERRWDGQRWEVVAATETFLVFAERKEGSQTGRHVIARADLAEGVEYNSRDTVWTFRLTRGGRAAVTSHGRPNEVVLVNLADGTSAVVFTAPVELDGKPAISVQALEGTADSFTAIVEYYRSPAGAEGPPGTPVFLTQHVSWDGALLDSSVGLSPVESTSPDGRHVVRETLLHFKPFMGEGSGEIWPATVLFDAAGRELLRLRSAGLSYGDNLPRNRWLADSSGFVAIIRDPGEPPVPLLPYRYAVVSLKGEIDILPMPPVGTEAWHTRPNINGPVPSPLDPDLLCFGRGYLYNRRTGLWFIPRLTDPNGPAHLFPNDSPWAAAPGEMVFAPGHGGHGGFYAPALLAPFLEAAPFPADPPMRFRVERTGACLNLREKPGEAEPIITCLPEGTVVELDLAGQILDPRSSQPTSYVESPAGTWARVAVPGGRQGWVATDYLGWAPAADSGLR